MDLSLVDEGGLGVVGLWDAPSAGCWVFRCLFGVGVGNGDGLGYPPQHLHSQVPQTLHPTLLNSVHLSGIV